MTFKLSESNPIASIAAYYLQPITGDDKKGKIKALTIANNYADFVMNGSANPNYWQQQDLTWLEQHEMNPFPTSPTFEHEGFDNVILAVHAINDVIEKRLILTLTAEQLLERLKKGERLLPKSWQKAALLSDGYCRYESHTFYEETPRTVGVSISPAIAGAREAISKYGNEWVMYHEPKPETKDERSLRVAREVIADMVKWGHITTETGTSAYYVGEKVLPIIMGRDDD